VLCEILNPDGTMARLPELIQFKETHGLKMCSIADLIAYRRTQEKLVQREQAPGVAGRGEAQGGRGRQAHHWPWPAARPKAPGAGV
jgi:hypothetical protein